MQLDRNKNPDGVGKYALVLLRRAHPIPLASAEEWNRKYYVVEESCMDFGRENEFFVLRLKDKHAAAALFAYSESIAAEDPEFSMQVRDLAVKSEEHPNRHAPD